jgi:hypothetical protein
MSTGIEWLSLSPFAFRLSPFAFRLSPFAFRLSPFAFRLSPFAYDATCHPASRGSPLGLPTVVFYLPVFPDQASKLLLKLGLLGLRLE